jgi:hypothetical protein
MDPTKAPSGPPVRTHWPVVLGGRFIGLKDGCLCGSASELLPTVSSEPSIMQHTIAYFIGCGLMVKRSAIRNLRQANFFAVFISVSFCTNGCVMKKRYRSLSSRHASREVTAKSLS